MFIHGVKRKYFRCSIEHDMFFIQQTWIIIIIIIIWSLVKIFTIDYLKSNWLLLIMINVKQLSPNNSWTLSWTEVFGFICLLFGRFALIENIKRLFGVPWFLIVPNNYLSIYKAVYKILPSIYLIFNQLSYS